MTESWEKITAVTATMMLIVIIASFILPPVPRVTFYNDVVIQGSLGWTTYRLDVMHQGEAPMDCTVDSGLILEWKTNRLNIGEYSASKSSPAVDENTIYIGLDTGAIIALDRQTGEHKWSYYTRFSKNGIHGSPTVDPLRNLVFIGAYDGWLYALNRETGKLVWDAKLGDYIGSSPTLYKGTVYIGVEMREPNGYIVGVNADTGYEVYRSKKLGNHPHGTPTIDPESGCIFIGENNGVFHSYWLRNETERWSFQTGDDIKSTAAVYAGVVYLTSWDGKLYAINITNGISIWTHNSRSRSMSSPTINKASGLVYYGNHEGILYAVNISTGNTEWEYQTHGKILSSPTLITGTNTLIIGSSDRGAYLLNAETGELKQRIELTSGLTGVPVTVGNRLYIFDHLGLLYSFIGT